MQQNCLGRKHSEDEKNYTKRIIILISHVQQHHEVCASFGSCFVPELNGRVELVKCTLIVDCWWNRDRTTEVKNSAFLRVANFQFYYGVWPRYDILSLVRGNPSVCASLVCFNQSNCSAKSWKMCAYYACAYFLWEICSWNYLYVCVRSHSFKRGLYLATADKAKTAQ